MSFYYFPSIQKNLHPNKIAGKHPQRHTYPTGFPKIPAYVVEFFRCVFRIIVWFYW